jgi:tripartite-type tricarboxylate transporter receptor subunit TctC
MKGLRSALTLACIGLSAAPAHAQAYPSKPVTIVVTLAAGGAADVIARAAAQRLAEEWGQPVVVENNDQLTEISLDDAMSYGQICEGLGTA